MERLGKDIGVRGECMGKVEERKIWEGWREECLEKVCMEGSFGEVKGGRKWKMTMERSEERNVEISCQGEKESGGMGENGGR